jgi:hypothetical protein
MWWSSFLCITHSTSLCFVLVNVKTFTCICWDEDRQDSRPRRRGVPTLLYGIDCDMTIALRPGTTLAQAKAQWHPAVHRFIGSYYMAS